MRVYLYVGACVGVAAAAFVLGRRRGYQHGYIAATMQATSMLLDKTSQRIQELTTKLDALAASMKAP